MTEDWNHMLDFTDELLKHAEEHFLNYNSNSSKQYVFQRISIIHFHHALELFMKAYLIKEGYFIYKIDNNDIKKGIKLSKIFEQNRTLDFMDILKIFKEFPPLSDSQFESVKELNRLRNEIQHRSLVIDVDKNEVLKQFKNVMSSIYEKTFPERPCPLSNIQPDGNTNP